MEKGSDHLAAFRARQEKSAGNVLLVVSAARKEPRGGEGGEGWSVVFTTEQESEKVGERERW